MQTLVNNETTFTLQDMFEFGLNGEGSKDKRRFVGEKLGIGYCNSKQFVNRLNNYGITIEQLLEVINQYK